MNSMEDNIRSSHLQELVDEDDEALSFCDIPIYTDASADWGGGSSGKENHVNENSSFSTSSSSEEEDFFEFFRSSLYQPESFVFCGKLIPYGDSFSQKKAGFGQWKQDITNNGGKGRMSRISSMKASGWYKVLFGSMRFSGQMELADIKNRQRRHRKPKAMFGMYEDNERKRSSTNGFIGLVRSFSCRGHYSTNTLETSFQ